MPDINLKDLNYAIEDTLKTATYDSNNTNINILLDTERRDAECSVYYC